MGPSSPDQSRLNQRIVSRIRAAVRNLASAREQIKKEGVKGDTDNSLQRLLVGIVKKVEAQVEQILQEIAEISREDIKIGRSDRVHRNLEQFLFQLDLIRTTTLQIPLELNYFTRATFHQLGHKDVKVVLIPGASLGTANLSEALMSIFVFFDDVLTYIRSDFPFYWIVLVPPSLVRTPLNWPLVTHEIGHILERQEWNLVKAHYPYPAVPSLAPPDMKSYYAQEFQADFVAASYFGPVFASRLLEVYYTREFVISKTHPSWKERFDCIADKLVEMGFSTEATRLKEESVGEEPSMIGRSSVERLPEILSKTEAKMSEPSRIYVQNHEEEKKAKSRLGYFAPYTDDMRTLLNVAEEARENILQSTSDPAKKRELETDFDYLLIDSIRLTYIKQISQPAFSS